MKLGVRLLVSIMLLTTAGFIEAAQNDITFIVAGKTSNHRQHEDGSLQVLNFHFFAEIFLRPGGVVEPASLVTPLSQDKKVKFKDGGYALELHGGRYPTEHELEAAYPDGQYVFHYTSPGTGRAHQVVNLGNPNAVNSGLPVAPQIKLSQRGVPVAAANVDPEQDLRVNWSDFSAGGADPQGIMDDLLFVIMGDCDGERRAHSGRPYENTPYLTYADKEYTIEAEKLRPDNVYQLSVEHAILDTSQEHGVTAFATFATSTFLDIHTTGTAPPGQACRSVRKAFDAGQTDR